MGPVIYCAEWADNGARTSNIILPAEAQFTTAFMPELLNGVAVLKTNVLKVEADSITGNVQTVKRPFTAIPYYAKQGEGGNAGMDSRENKGCRAYYKNKLIV